MKYNRFLNLILILFNLNLAQAPDANAQTQLGVEEVIRVGLEQNYSIRIARNSAEISENNRTLGSSGFLPSLDAGGGYNLANSEQKTNSPFSFGNSDNESWNGQLQLNWTLFDGFKMFADKKRYDQLADLGQSQSRNAIESTVVAIMRAYYNLVLQAQLLEVAQNTLAISETRLNKEQVRNDLGSASSTDLLNARVSFNNDKAGFINQKLQVDIARKDLNIILGQAPETPLAVIKNITIPHLGDGYETILQRALKNNSALEVARKNLQIAEQLRTASKSSLYPRLLFNGNYSYNDQTVESESRGSITTESANKAAGLTLSWNLFNGFRNRVEIQNARIESKNRKLTLMNEENRLAGLVREKLDTFNNQMELITLDEENVVAAAQNLELQQDRYRIGTATSLEFRDAQLNLARAQNNLIAARYLARISRLEIDQLIGEIKIR